MRWKVVTLSGVVAILCAAALFVGNTGNKESAKQEAGTIKQMVQDFSTRKATAASASITSTQLIVTGEDSKEAAYDLPEDEFFLSIAPYEESTHPCAIHSLTGCQGEMTDKEFIVTINDADGKVVLDKAAMKSQSNGFIDLWLPRDQTYRITVEHEGKTAESEISTYKQDNTCLTTMQLG
ncbi:hypothetical protein GCM10010912_10520 [Paenibacillus albidus]|uniref:CueP family metal-binding protein n=1 Tax=Paenibacillus albidus TaxID=2041023 RepID=A0A917C181_9BACL|nr:CueP family metal-binding protein [Paenibacillus albidus]GGF67432.1 hypothetical protein GCM10010912_10520 [Paenibacillus albidus]